MSVLLLSLSTLIALGFACFCAGAETAFLSVSRERILHLAREGGRKAQVVQRVLGDMPRAMTTLLIGNNLASVAYSTATAALIADGCADSLVRSLWSFLAAFTVLYVSEFLPKLLCAARPLRRSLYLAPAYAAVEVGLRPLTWLAMRLTNVFMGKGGERKYRLTSADLLRILQDRKDGVCLSDFESALIGRLIVLRTRRRPVTTESLLSALRDFD